MGFFSFFKKKDTVDQTEEKEKQSIDNTSIQEEQKLEDKSTNIKDINDLVDGSENHDDILKKVAEALDLDLDDVDVAKEESHNKEFSKENVKEISSKDKLKEDDISYESNDKTSFLSLENENKEEVIDKKESLKDDNLDKKISINTTITENNISNIENTSDNFLQEEIFKNKSIVSEVVENNSINQVENSILNETKDFSLDDQTKDLIGTLGSKSLESNDILEDNFNSSITYVKDQNTQNDIKETLDNASSDKSENLLSKEENEDTKEIEYQTHSSDSKDVSKEDLEKNSKLSFFAKLKKTRENLAYGVSSLIKGRKIDEELYEELETALLTADLGVDTCDYVIEKLRTESKLRALHDADLLKENLHNILVDLLKPCEVPLNIEDHKPFVILMVGVNGAGKTTTIGKLAQKYKSQGKKVMLAAGDTFRAAAVEQLKEWGKRIEVPVIAQGTGADSASVLYDALESAKSRKADVLICDTAGRLQNKDNLMDELRKIVRVLKKQDESVPHEVLLVLDAATGQNAVSQTKLFKEAVDVTGIALTKLDGTAKGGVIFALADKYKLPIRYVGIGERAEDLHEFKVDPFVQALIEDKNN